MRIFFISIICSLVLMMPCMAQVPELSSRAAIVTDGNGTVLYEKNSDLALPPASVTKIMTLLLAVEAVEQGIMRTDDMIVTSSAAAGEGGSQIWLKDGERMSAYDMMTSIAVVSANDAAFAVMEHLYGSENSAVVAMNRRAEELGMTNTHFANVNGLPNEMHRMSVRDVAILAREAVKHPLYMELCGKKEVWLRGGKNWLVNTNKLLWWYAGADGLKTGWTEDAKYCFAGTAVREGLRLFAVVFGAPEPRSHLKECMSLLDWGYRNYQYKRIATAGEVVGTVGIRRGSQQTVNLVAGDHIGYLEERGKQRAKVELVMPEMVDAPIEAGDCCGEMLVISDGEIIARGTLLAETSVKRAGFWQIVYRNLACAIGI